MSRLEDTQPFQPVGLPIHDEVLAEHEERRQLNDRLDATACYIPPNPGAVKPNRYLTLLHVVVLALVILASLTLLAAVTVHTR